METSRIDFGCILNNTEVSQDIKMTNIGPLVVNYKWKFVLEKDNIVSNLNMSNNELTSNLTINLENDHNLLSNIIGDPMSETYSQIENNEKIEQIEKEILDENKISHIDSQNKLSDDHQQSEQIKSHKLEELLSKSSLVELPNIEEIFDISPLYGCLHPGESQKLKITYYGHKEIKAYVRAVCEVQNGPNYELYLKGEASILSYEISNRIINFDYIVNNKFKILNQIVIY